jgi:hypothetical protein
MCHQNDKEIEEKVMNALQLKFKEIFPKTQTTQLFTQNFSNLMKKLQRNSNFYIVEPLKLFKVYSLVYEFIYIHYIFKISYQFLIIKY